ncbi:MAG: gliding motility protein GldC [Flavobacteriales bacterium]
MADNSGRNSEIRYTVKLDENQIPLDIEWSSSDEEGSKKCDAAFLAMWDREDKTTLRLDLWTKEFPMDEMKQFFHQQLLTMADSFQRATGEEAIVEDLRDYCAHFAEKMGLEEGNDQEGKEE